MSSTLVSMAELERCCREEGIDFSQVVVMAPRWAESAPRSEGAKSALVCCDCIIRSDGSAVFLDGAMAVDSMIIARQHMRNPNPLRLAWEEYVVSLKSA